MENNINPTTNISDATNQSNELITDAEGNKYLKYRKLFISDKIDSNGNILYSKHIISEENSSSQNIDINKLVCDNNDHDTHVSVGNPDDIKLCSITSIFPSIKAENSKQYLKCVLKMYETAVNEAFDSVLCHHL